MILIIPIVKFPNSCRRVKETVLAVENTLSSGAAPEDILEKVLISGIICRQGHYLYGKGRHLIVKQESIHFEKNRI